MKLDKIHRVLLIRFIFCLFLLQAAAPLAHAHFIHRQDPDFLTYNELKSLSDNPWPEGPLRKKLMNFWITPLISNEAYDAGSKPIAPASTLLGPYLRIATWNIEKSILMPEVIQMWTSKPAFEKMIAPEKLGDNQHSLEGITRQRDRLVLSDIIVLQEMDIGIKRSHYLNAAEELAKALHMNYAFGPQYLEIDPVNLGLEKLTLEDGAADKEAMDYYQVDPAKYKGVFGSAVLSRYPVKYVEVRPLKTQPYDWYWGEKQKVGFFEKSRRFGTKTLFKNEMTRELKVGGRNYFRVDLDVPQLPGGTLTIINIHLEIKCLPKGRAEQIQEILEEIREIKNPVIMLGDFNAAPADISPTSAARIVTRTLKNPTTWFGVAVNYISPYGLAINTTRGVTNVTKNFNDPFAKDIKIVAPNSLRRMFDEIRYFNFDDGQFFDFRGNPERSTGAKDGLLANSNQRGHKGFKTSFSVKRALGVIGKYRLDWIFVKTGYLKDSETDKAPYRFAPHFGETLEEMNTRLKQPLSDHHPSIVDLPFEEPRIKNS